MKAAPTPAPWHAGQQTGNTDESGAAVYVQGTGRLEHRRIAQTGPWLDDKRPILERMANARLMAAAPELFALAQLVVASNTEPAELERIAALAIAKATY